jgi:hypothetical protein
MILVNVTVTVASLRSERTPRKGDGISRVPTVNCRASEGIPANTTGTGQDGANLTSLHVMVLRRGALWPRARGAP